MDKIKRRIRTEILKYRNLLSTLKSINKCPIIAKYLLNLSFMIINLYIGSGLNSEFIEMLGTKNDSFVYVYFKMTVLTFIMDLYLYLESILDHFIELEFLKLAKSIIFDKFSKIKNEFFESYDLGGMSIAEICTQYSHSLYDQLFQFPNIVMKYSDATFKVILLLKNGILSTCVYFLLICICGKVHTYFGTARLFNLSKQTRVDLALIGINKKFVNNSVYSKPNHIKCLEKLSCNEKEIYQTKVQLHNFVEKIIMQILNCFIVKISGPTFVLFWFTSRHSIMITILGTLRSGMFNNFAQKKIEDLFKHMEMIGNKRDQVKIPEDFKIVVKSCKLEKIGYTIEDDIVISPHKTILIDGKTSMGKTVFYKIIMNLIGEQPPVFLDTNGINNKMELGFEHFSGQIKYISSINDKNLVDDYAQSCTVRNNLGHYKNENALKRALQLSELEVKLDDISNNLSSGAQKRLLMAKILPVDEEINIPILILDEPDNCVDYETGKAIIDNICDWFHKNHNGCIFLTTHQQILKLKIKFDDIYRADNMSLKKCSNSIYSSELKK